MRRALTSHSNDERGVALIMVALMLVALIGMVGLAVDGGAMFADHRQTQNGADAAALAGANALNTALTLSTNAVGHEADAYNAVLSSITINRASSGSTQAAGTAFTCYIIDQYQTSLGTCPMTTGAGLPASSDGVLVTLGDTRTTNFIQAVGPKSFTVNNHAAALIESYAPTSSISPYMICAVGSADSRAGTLSTSFPSPPILQLNSSSINPAAIGQTYALEDNAAPNCGVTNDASFKGLTTNGSHSLPGTWVAATGRSGFQVGPGISGTCSTRTVGCMVLVPLCYAGGGGWLCSKMAVFQITGTTSNSTTAILVSGGVVTGGQGGGQPASGDPRLIKLVQ